MDEYTPISELIEGLYNDECWYCGFGAELLTAT
jgi:hypothetical protein